jgi:RNA polymerase sigma-70 factor (ECF subfamily)
MRAYQDMVFSTAVRLTANRAQAEDIAQEVFLKAYEHFAQLRESTSAGGWLKTVATNLSLNHLSRYRRRWRLFSELGNGEESDSAEPAFLTPDSLHDSTFNELDAEDRRRVVEDALARLPDHQRIPLVLFHFEELPYEDIAVKLDASLSKVKTDIHRARLALARSLATRAAELSHPSA